MNWRRMRVPVVSLYIVCLLLMAGCGQKGDLYFPKDKTAVSQPPQQN